MLNETYFVVIAFINFSLILVLGRFAKEWLYTAVVVNLILISALGAKLVSVFGLITNTGNIFYVGVFLSTYLLIEHYGQKAGYRTIWLGAGGVVFFVLMTQLALVLNVPPQEHDLQDSMQAVFQTTPRIAFASVIAYVFAQFLNVWMYGRLRERMEKKLLWFRVGATSFVVQFFDSIIFFLIAFLGVIPPSEVLQVIGVGYLIKIIASMFAIPFLYASYILKKEE